MNKKKDKLNDYLIPLFMLTGTMIGTFLESLFEFTYSPLFICIGIVLGYIIAITITLYNHK